MSKLSNRLGNVLLGLAALAIGSALAFIGLAYGPPPSAAGHPTAL